MSYKVKEFKDGFSFDVFANGEFLQNVIVYNLIHTFKIMNIVSENEADILAQKIN